MGAKLPMLVHSNLWQLRPCKQTVQGCSTLLNGLC